MTTDEIAAEAAEEQIQALEKRGYLDFDSGEQEDRESVKNQLTGIIKSAIEKALLHQKPGESTDLAYEVGRRSPATHSDDTKRLDWLESNGCGLQLVLNSWKWRNKSFREAIDAAMRKEKK